MVDDEAAFVDAEAAAAVLSAPAAVIMVLAVMFTWLKAELVSFNSQI